MTNEAIEGDEWTAYGVLVRMIVTKHGIASKGRPSWQRSLDSSQRLGKPTTRRSQAGDLNPNNGKVREMRDADTILGIIRERGRRGLPLEDLYRQLYNPMLYLRAYARLYANKGATTPGATSETVDGMSRKKIDAIIEALRYERYRWTPVRRTYIPKKKGKKLRPLGLPSWSDKLLQEVIRLILEAYFEPQFSPHSHGFRPERGCHTALQEIEHTWQGTKWFIEGDIRGCFDHAS